MEGGRVVRFDMLIRGLAVGLEGELSRLVGLHLGSSSNRPRSSGCTRKRSLQAPGRRFPGHLRLFSSPRLVASFRRSAPALAARSSQLAARSSNSSLVARSSPLMARSSSLVVARRLQLVARRSRSSSLVARSSSLVASSLFARSSSLVARRSQLVAVGLLIGLDFVISGLVSSCALSSVDSCARVKVRWRL